jgi:hypothetical protein
MKKRQKQHYTSASEKNPEDSKGYLARYGEFKMLFSVSFHSLIVAEREILCKIGKQTFAIGLL